MEGQRKNTFFYEGKEVNGGKGGVGVFVYFRATFRQKVLRKFTPGASFSER